MKLCKHDSYKTITDIWEPRYSTQSVLINVNKVGEKTEHFLLKFSKAPAYPNWLYFSGKDIRKSPKQKNGGGEVYAVPLSKAEDFEPVLKCQHDLK